MDFIENCDEFYKLLKNYTNVFYKNLLIKYLSNPSYLEMLYVNGLFILKNIYILLFFYCENINEVLLLVEKAYIYYIEFLIQINLNSITRELDLRDAVLFTYKRTVLIYNKHNNNSNNTMKEKINKELDNYFNVLCNFFYLTANRNFIEYKESLVISNDNANDYINLFVIHKITTIEELEKKLRKYVMFNTNIQEFNNIILVLRDKIEKKFSTKIDAEMNGKMNGKINAKIHYLLDNYQTINLLNTNICFIELD